MRAYSRCFVPLAALLVASLLPAAAPASARIGAQQPAQADRSAVTSQIIVQLREGGLAGIAAAAPDDVAERLSNVAGEELDYSHAGPAPGTHLLSLSEPLPVSEVAELAARIAESPEVLYAEPDRFVRTTRVPSDPLFTSANWHLQATASGSYGANLPAAWDITTGAESIVTAIIDTGGLLAHEDLAGRTIAGNPGYDMISNAAIANDGTGRDNNPADPGDWIDESETDDAADPLVDIGCPLGSTDKSSWHGSHVGGTIGASANNGRGVTGINWSSKLLFLRALGKCGGFNSDIAAAIRWAAGLPVSGAPTNPNPARVINMSLGGPSACDTTTQNAINAARAAGSVIVVAAGNENTNLDAVGKDTSPAECTGVIAVAASTRSGNRAYYSNYGSAVDIAAPGGGPKNNPATEAGEAITSTVDKGLRGPEGDAYGPMSGTSMASPHVAGVVSLMLSVNPALTTDQVQAILQATVTPFPAGSSCNTSICGAGILNAGKAVDEAARLARTVGWRDAGQVVNEGAGSVNIPVRLSVGSNQAVSVPYTVSGTAGAGDYTLAAGAVTFAPGATSGKISFALTDDAATEAQETIVVTLGTPEGSPAPAAIAGPATHTITLLDNDSGAPAATLSIGGATAGEGFSTVLLSFTTQRGGPAVPAGVTYTVRAVGASSAAPPLVEGEVALGAAESTKSVSVTLSRAQLGQATGVRVELSAPTGGAVLGPQSSAQAPLTPLNYVFLPIQAR